jgi:hypothetical protein
MRELKGNEFAKHYVQVVPFFPEIIYESTNMKCEQLKMLLPLETMAVSLDLQTVTWG